MQELPVPDAVLSDVLYAEAAGISDDGAVVVESFLMEEFLTENTCRDERHDTQETGHEL